MRELKYFKITLGAVLIFLSWTIEESSSTTVIESSSFDSFIMNSSTLSPSFTSMADSSSSGLISPTSTDVATMTSFSYSTTTASTMSSSNQTIGLTTSDMGSSMETPNSTQVATPLTASSSQTLMATQSDMSSSMETYNATQLASSLLTSSSQAVISTGSVMSSSIETSSTIQTLQPSSSQTVGLNSSSDAYVSSISSVVVLSSSTSIFAAQSTSSAVLLSSTEQTSTSEAATSSSLVAMSSTTAPTSSTVIAASSTEQTSTSEAATSSSLVAMSSTQHTSTPTAPTSSTVIASSSTQQASTSEATASSSIVASSSTQQASTSVVQTSSSIITASSAQQSSTPAATTSSSMVASSSTQHSSTSAVQTTSSVVASSSTQETATSVALTSSSVDSSSALPSSSQASSQTQTSASTSVAISSSTTTASSSSTITSSSQAITTSSIVPTSTVVATSSAAITTTVTTETTETTTLSVTTASSATEQRLMGFSNDAHLPTSAEYSPYIFPPFAVPIGGFLYPSFYFTRSGLMLFTNVTSEQSESGHRLAFANPQQSFSQIGNTDLQEKAVVAFWWANMNIQGSDSSRGIYYKEYQSSVSAHVSTLDTVSAEINAIFVGSNFVGKYMIVITYNKMGYPADDTKTVTFQGILITDYKNSYVKIVYGDQAMNWEVTAGGQLTNYPARIGFMQESASAVVYPYSYTDIGNTETTQKKMIEIIDNVTINDVSGLPAQIKGSGKGKMFFKLTSHGSSFIHNGVVCQDWIVNDIATITNPIPTDDEKKCPGATTQLTSAAVTFSSPRIPTGVTCYLERKAVMANATSPDSVRCCYNNSNNAIILSHTLANGMNTYRRQSGTEQNTADATYSVCCNPSYSYLSREDLCTQFLTRRPVCTSESFQASAAGGAVGDPHLGTLDGKEYTFNGLGEFDLMKGDSFAVQGRFSPVGGSATYISAIAGKQSTPESDLVEIRMNSTKDGVEFLRNGQPVEVDLSAGPIDWNQVTIARTNDTSSPPIYTYSMIFTGGITAGVKLQFKMFQLVTEVASTWLNQTKGLLGNFNGISEDDFIKPDGTVMSLSTEEEIYSYGVLWQNTNETSLFTYSNEDSWDTYVNSSFQPIFFNSNLTIMFPNDTLRQLAESTCYQSGQTDPDPSARKQCYLDFAATGDASLAAGTTSSLGELQDTQASLANYPPEIKNGNVTLRVTKGFSYATLLLLDVEDQNGDNITYSLSEAPVGVSVSNATSVLSWNSVPDLISGRIMLTVSDGKVEAIFTPNIQYCKCENGDCDFNITSNDLFVIVPCVCHAGYDGTFCTEDIDGCLDSPCAVNVQCTDIAASQASSSSEPYSCGPCPTGLVGDGKFCEDENECVTQQPCSQTCTNIAGGYTCSCTSGYELSSDSRTCLDIDECFRGTDSCSTSSTTCTNTPGSYICPCRSGYESSSNAHVCTDIDECSSGSSSCPANSVCVNSVGSYACNCNHGYVKDPQTNTCNDKDECSLPNDCEQVCNNGVGAYTCGCNTGFVLQSDNTTCSPSTVCNSTQRDSCDGGNPRSKCAVSSFGDVLCVCPQGFSKNSSDYCIDIDECATESDSCDKSSSTCVNTEGEYYCACLSGYGAETNFTCTDVDECSAGSDNCVSPATCVNYNGGFRCTCPSGYNLNNDGRNCDNIDECAQPTLNNCDQLQGTCSDTNGGYTCTCKSGYTGSGYVCADINECAAANKGGCTQSCFNTQGSFYCGCYPGYLLQSDGQTCNDVNECLDSNDNTCIDNNHCTNTVGGFTCSCPANFTLKGDGFTCESIFKCEANHNCGYKCGKIDDIDTCQCSQGYELDSTGKNCTDIFECNDTNLHDCNSSNNVLCRNTQGSYECDCLNSSYVKTAENICTDKDECITNTHNCPANSACVNSNPGFSCPCNTGFTLVGSGCQDIDECTSGTHNCHAQGDCNNTPGGYTCTCKTGYQGDGITCTDVDECVQGSHQCDQNADRRICTNTVGSYSCNCTANYVLAGDGRTCNDVDECTSGLHNCQMTCENTVGGYRCTCQPGMTLNSDQRTCTVDVECNADYAANCSYQCAKINNVDTCICETGYTLGTDAKTCIDIDECTASPPCDSNHGACTNTAGSYTCSCMNDYILGPGNVCNDRNGNWTVWGTWGSCSKSCGSGTQSRSRTCTNPSKQGNGADCVGSSSESQNCNTDPCPANAVERTYGVILSFSGVTIIQFNTIAASFKQQVKDSVNTYCNYNVSTTQQCCNTTTGYTPNPSSPKAYTATDSIAFSADYPVYDADGDLLVMIVVKYVANNDLCIAASGYTSTRRKRSITLGSLEFAIPQAILNSILSDASTQTDIVNAMVQAIQSATGQTLNITMGEIALVTAAPTATTTTQAPGEATKPKSWIIAVAVVGSIVGAMFLALMVVIVVKITKKNKVTPVENNPE